MHITLICEQKKKKKCTQKDWSKCFSAHFTITRLLSAAGYSETDETRV